MGRGRCCSIANEYGGNPYAYLVELAKIAQQDGVIKGIIYVISSAGLPCNTDHLHFSAEGYRQFGKRYAEKMLSTLGYKVNQTMSPTTRRAAGVRLRV